MLKGVSQGLTVYTSRNKNCANGLISTATTHYIMRRDAWEHLLAISVLYYVVDVITIRILNKGVPSGLFSPV